MTAMTRTVLLGVVALGALSASASAQDSRRVIGPRVASAPVYRYGPQRGYAASPRYLVAPHRVMVRPHTHQYRDWTTGREDLPLAKPWLHPGQ